MNVTPHLMRGPAATVGAWIPDPAGRACTGFGSVVRLQYMCKVTHGSGQADEVNQRSDLDEWFQQEVLPLEAALTRFLRRNWGNESDLADFRQELYANVYESVQKNGRPAHARAFVFVAARNLLINSMRRSRVIQIERVANITELDVLGVMDFLTPERQAEASEDLQRLQCAIDGLPPRCREVFWMRRIEGRSQKQVAAALGIGLRTVEEQMRRAMRQLVIAMLEVREEAVENASGRAGAEAGAGK